MKTIKGMKAILARLVAIPSPSGQEEAVSEAIREYAGSCGVSVEEVQGNVLIPLCHGARKAVILNAHMDTVQIQQGWLTDPFTLTEKDGRWFGWGISDEKVSIAMLLDLIGSLNDAKADVFLAFVKNEEIDGSGSDAVAGYFREKYLHQYEEVLCILCEPTNAAWIELGNKGSIFFELTSIGKAAHGSKPDRGENAILKMFNIIKSISRSFEGFQSDSNLLGPPSLAIPTTIQGGSSVNAVPDRCVVTGDIRTNTACHAAIIDFLAGIPECRVISQTAPYLLENRQDLISLFEAAGISNKMFTTGSNDAVFFGKIGIPSIVFGPGNKECIHQPNEFVDMDSIEKARAVILKVVEAYASS